MAGSAQGAVDLLLGGLSSVLLDEAKLLRGVRRDVEFIKDEMESMNNFLLDVASIDHPSHQVQGWSRHVKELAFDCRICIVHYIQCFANTPGTPGGLLGALHRAQRLLCTLLVRHRIATRIRELKERAHELAERRLRYDVALLRAAPAACVPMTSAMEKVAEEDDARWRIVEKATSFFNDDVREVIGWVTKELPHGHPQCHLRAITIMRRQYQEDEYPLARKVYDHPSMSSCFNFKAWIRGVEKYTKRHTTLQCILEQLIIPHSNYADMNEETLVEKLRDHLKGKRFLIVAANDPDGLVLTEIQSALSAADGVSYTSGSAIIVTTWLPPHDELSVHYKVKNYLHIGTFFHEKAVALVGDRCDSDMKVIIRRILMKRGMNSFSMEMFLRALYINPNITREELEHLLGRLTYGSILATHMIQYCYNDLPSHYKNCLLYLSILFERMNLQSSFPEDLKVKRTSIVRRWVAENLITRRDGLDATDEAERCFDALVVRGLVRPVDIGAAGKVKSCTLHHRVLSFITRMAREEGLVDTDLPPELAYRLSLHSEIWLQQLELFRMENKTKKKKNVNSAQECYQEIGYTEAFLELLPTCPLVFVEVLDLDGFKGLKKHHLRDISNKIFRLKYLSIRNTDVTELPRDIDKLRYLQTLDIRQTKIRKITTKVIALPKLMHLLAGRIDHQGSGAGRSFSTVHMPHGIGSMTDLQILCHVEVSKNAHEFMEVGRLQKLRKLGVVLSGKEVRLSYFLWVIERLSECLRSLSVQLELTNNEIPDLNIEKTAFSSYPRFLESLNISGNITGLPSWIKELPQLTKITLRGTSLLENAIRILGELTSLRCLRLCNRAYIETRLILKHGEFHNLKYLLVESSDITTIHFVNEAAPKLKKIVWTFREMVSLSGVQGLPLLNEIELNGNCNPYRIIKDMAEHPNHPVVIHKCNP